MVESGPDAQRQHAASVEPPPSQRHVAFEPVADGFVVRVDRQGAFAEGEPLYLGTVTLEGQDAPVRVTLHRREGSSVLVRQADPCDIDVAMVPVYDRDHIKVMQAISHYGIHTNPEPGSVDGFLFGCRIVPVRVEGDKVYARSLRRDENDDGRRVHAIPGGQVIFEEGTLVAELDHIDDQAEATSSGHVPLAPVLWAWLNIRTGHDEVRTRYLMAAARRLDTANLLLIEIGRRMDQLNEDGLAGPAIRRNLFELVGLVELAVISLGRAVDMVIKAKEQIDRDVPIPKAVVEAREAVKDIRDAYEHIDERAAGNVWRKPHPDALTIFNWQRLVSDDMIIYGSHELELSGQVPELVTAMRQFFKDAAADG